MSVQEFFLGGNIVLAGNTIKIFLPGRILDGILEEIVSLGGIPASTYFSMRFLPRYEAEIFPRKDPVGRMAHLDGIPVRILAIIVKLYLQVGKQILPGTMANSISNF